MAALLDEHQQWELSSGVPLVNGKIYIGSRNQDPVLNPITIYSDRALATVLSQPQRTDASGRAENKIHVPGRYSIKVTDENDVQLYQNLDAGEEAASGITSLSNVQGIDAITAEATPAITAYSNQEIYVFRAAASNTGAVTLDAGGGATAVVKNDDEALVAGDILADQIVMVAYDETDDQFEIANHSGSLQNVLTTQHDIVVRGASVPERLAIGATNRTVLGRDSSGALAYFHQGAQLIETADLTNGGADDLTEYALSHTLEDGYRYILTGRNVSGNTATWFPRLQFQTSGGSFRTGGTDYEQSFQGNSASPAGTNNDSAAHIALYSASISSAASLIDFRAEITSAMDSSNLTGVVWDTHLKGSGVAVRSYGAGTVQTAEANDAVRISLGGVHTFDSGVMELWRIKEPT